MASIDWDALRSKDVQPPFVPDVSACRNLFPCQSFMNVTFLQMKKANFDVSHELDEFMMVEKPLTHSKRKAHPDLEKMKPELRQLEEQFTIYDFSKNNRISYYPHNQTIVTSINGEEEPSTVLQSATNTLLPTTTVDRSLARSPSPDTDLTHSQTVGITQRAESRAS